jgi:hypothetical protein
MNADIQHIVNPSTVNNIGVVEYFTRYRHNRAAIRARTGVPALPADRCPSFVIPEGRCVCEDKHTLKTVEKELQKVDPRFRIIYDPLTAVNGGPGYHLYLQNRNKYPNGLDELVLEFSIQRDCTKNWPTGGPCTPGMWLVDFVKRNLKKDWTDYVDRTRERQEARAAREANRDAEEQRMYYKEVFHPTYVRGGLGQTGTSKDLKRVGRTSRAKEHSVKTKITSISGKGNKDRRRADYE